MCGRREKEGEVEGGLVGGINGGCRGEEGGRGVIERERMSKGEGSGRRNVNQANIGSD